MKNKLIVDGITYEIIRDNKNGFKEEDFKNRYTDYFYDFDYIVGDWAYDKLRLKGFYDDSNPKAKKINKISTLDEYLNNNCAYGCKYFVAKKINI